MHEAGRRRGESKLQADVADYLRRGIDAAMVEEASRTAQGEITSLKEREAAIRHAMADAEAQAAILDEAVALAEQGAETLSGMDASERAELLRRLRLQVQVTDSSRTPGLLMTGVLCDPAGQSGTIPRG